MEVRKPFYTSSQNTLKTIIDYDIIIASPKLLAVKVKAAVEEGWEINGEMYPHYDAGKPTGRYVQCIVLPDESGY